MIFHKNNYIEIIPTREMIKLANERAKQIGHLKNSVSHGENVIYGTLAEVMVETFGKFKYVGDYNYDLEHEGKRYEIKGKPCASIPEINYACTVYEFNTGQETDYYTFVRILKDLSKGWILGNISKKKFFNKAKFIKKGTFDGGTLVTKADAWNLEIKYLDPFPGAKVNEGILTWS